MSPIHADSAQELLCKLGQLDISVPPRTKERTTEQCERWSICRFLASFSDSELLPFPINLVHRDKPDFLLELDQQKVGIEVTEAIHENAAAIDAYRKNKGIDGVFSVKRHLPENAKLRGAELRREASSNDPGDGWAGDSVEHEWAGAMKNSVIGKVAKSKKPDFELFKRNWLLIYDNWFLPGCDRATAVKKLFDSLEYEPFENIFIECSSKFWVINNNGFYSRTINNLWAGS